MKTCWIDSGVLIESHHRYHPHDRIPAFWTWLDECLEKGLVRMPHRAYREITYKKDDWLAKWCRGRRTNGLDIPPDSETEEAYTAFVEYVSQQYSHVPHQVGDSLRGADGWVVAAAKANRGIAITQENRALRSDTSRIKIPNVCKKLNVPWGDTFDMLRRLNARFG